MTSKEFRKWLDEHYGRGQRLTFITDYNDMAKGLGDEAITLDGLENWLYRQPPKGRRFEETLDMLLAWRELAKPIVKVYIIHLPVTAERNQAIKELAGDGKHAAQKYLEWLLNWSLQEQIEGYLEGIQQQARAPQPRGRPSKPILITPEPESRALLEFEPSPKRVKKSTPKKVQTKGRT